MSNNMELDRRADLHYAFQFGQDFARTNDESIKREVDTKFGGDAEAKAEFDRGVADVQAKAGRRD